MDEVLRSLIDAPLADPLKINLPMGRRPARREAKEKLTPAPGDLTPSQARERRAKAAASKMEAVLAYYAGTSIPFERVAEHTGLPLERVVQIMKDMGREK